MLAASRLFLSEIEAIIEARQDFAFETSLSGRSYIKLVLRLRARGWRIELIYLALPDVEASRLRVAERVRHGGHHIPEDDIARRFPRSLHNLLYLFAPIVDQAHCLMNHTDAPISVFKQAGQQKYIFDLAFYQLLMQRAKP